MSEYVRRVSEYAVCFGSQLEIFDLELTERCDNDCIHCCINRPAGDSEAREREMPTDLVANLLHQAADLGCLQVRFTGGEPLLRPDFEELYLIARRLGLKVLIFTNARRLTPRMVELLSRVPPLVPLEVSVYGMHQASYEAVTRAPGSFRQFWAGVSLLLEHGVPFVVKAALLPPTRGEIDELEAWSAGIPGMERRPDYSMFFDLRGRRDDPEKNRLIESLRVTPEEGLAILARDETSYRLVIEEFAARFMGPPGDRLFRCGAGCGLSVDAYGFAQPCLGLRAPELTVDVRSHGLADALERFARLGELRATNPQYLGRCAVCRLHGFCAQCPAKSWAEHGTLDTPVDYLCHIAHAQARFLGWLGEGGNAWETQRMENVADNYYAEW